MAPAWMSFLFRPQEAQVLAATPSVEKRSALVACMLMLSIVLVAGADTVLALLRRPQEGLLNLGELVAGFILFAFLLRRLRAVSTSLWDAVKRLSIAVAAVTVLWLLAAVLLLLLAVMFKLDGSQLWVRIVTNAIAIAIYFGMLIHAFQAVSRVLRLMKP